MHNPQREGDHLEGGYREMGDSSSVKGRQHESRWYRRQSPPWVREQLRGIQSPGTVVFGVCGDYRRILCLYLQCSDSVLLSPWGLYRLQYSTRILLCFCFYTTFSRTVYIKLCFMIYRIHPSCAKHVSLFTWAQNTAVDPDHFCFLATVIFVLRP